MNEFKGLVFVLDSPFRDERMHLLVCLLLRRIQWLCTKQCSYRHARLRTRNKRICRILFNLEVSHLLCTKHHSCNHFKHQVSIVWLYYSLVCFLVVGFQTDYFLVPIAGSYSSLSACTMKLGFWHVVVSTIDNKSITTSNIFHKHQSHYKAEHT